MNAAACAVGLAGLPFDGPVASVRLGWSAGEWVVNPTFQQIDEATFDVVVAGSKNADGGVDILMIEGEAPDGTWPLLAGGATAPTEEIVAEGLEVAKRAIGELIGFQREFIAEARRQPSRTWMPTSALRRGLCGSRSSVAADRLAEAPSCPTRPSARPRSTPLKDEAKGHLAAQLGDEGSRSAAASSAPRGSRCRRRSCVAG